MLLQLNSTFPRALRAALVATLLSGAVNFSRVHAATIVFTSPSTITADTDVLTAGTFLQGTYWRSSGTSTVNGVTFTSTTTGSGNIGTYFNVSGAGMGSNVSDPFNSGTNPFNSLSASYKALLLSGAYGTAGSGATVTLRSLTIDHRYATQFWVNDPRPISGRQETVTSVGGNSVTLKYSANNVAGSPGQYTIGLFTADAATQAFTLTPGNGTTPSQLETLQLRDVTGIGYWTGLGGANWDSATTNNFASNLYTAALNNTTFNTAKAPLNGVVFTDTYWANSAQTAVATSAITVEAAGVSTGNVVFDNNGVDYALTNASGATGITGTTAVSKTGSGTVTFNSDNSYTGATTISAGTLQVGNGGTSGTLGNASAVALNGGTLTYFRADNSFVVTNAISGSGTLTFKGTGVISQSSYSPSGSNANFTGALNIDNARLIVDNANDVGSASSITITSGGQIYIPNATTIARPATIAGSGWLEGAGQLGALRLDGGANYSGGITLSGAAKINSHSGTGTVSGTINTNGNTLTLSTTNTGNLAVSNVISGNGALIASSAAGTSVTLSAINTYTGTTTVNSGTLLLTSSDSSHAYNGGNIFINNGSTLRIRGVAAGNRYDLNNSIGGHANIITFDSNGGGTLDLPSGNLPDWYGNTYKTTGGAQNTISGGSGTNGGFNINTGVTVKFDVAPGTNPTSDLVVSTNMWNAGSIQKLGTGTMTLSGANAFTGGTTISDGSIIVGNASAFGGNAVGNGKLTIDASGTVITGIGFNLQAVGRPDLGNQDLTVNGNASFNNNMHIVNSGPAANPVNGFGIGGAGTLTWGGTMTFSNAAGAMFGVSDSVTFKMAPGSSISLTGNTTNYLPWINGDATLQIDGGSFSNVGTNGGNTAFIGGTLIMNSGSFSSSGGASGIKLQQQNNGGGGLANDPGTVILNGGTLSAVGFNSSSASSLVVFNGGTLRALASNASFLPSPITTKVQAGGLIFDSQAFAPTIDAVLAHDAALGPTLDGGLRKLGAGTLILGGANTFTGDSRIINGTLRLNNILALQNSTLDMNGADAGALSFGTLTSATFGGLKGSRNLSLDNTTPAAVALTVGNNNQSTTYSGILSGSGSLTKIGTGTLTLTNANTYGGATTVQGGTLQLDAGGKVSNTSSITVGNSSGNGTLLVTTTGPHQLGTGEVVLGSTGGSTGTFNLQATGGTVSLVDSLVVGDAGVGIVNHASGVLNIGNGDATDGIGDLILGRNAGAASSSYDLAGGSVTADNVYIGQSGGMSGSPHLMSVGPGTTLTALRDLVVGAGGYGRLSQNGGTVNVQGVPTAIIGDGSTGTYDLDGGGLLAIAGNAEVGTNGGNGTMNHNDGTVTVGQNLTVGDAGSTGVYNLANNAANSLTVTGSEFIGVSDGVGTFTQSGGTHVLNGPSSNLTIGASGQFNLAGGTLDFRDYVGAGAAWTPNNASTITTPTGGQFSFTGGNLYDVSTITVSNGSNFTQEGGNFYIGQDGTGPAALTTINGGFSLVNGILHLDAFGVDATPEVCCDGIASLNDQLTVTGDATLDSVVNIDFVGFTPVFGDVFTLICANDIAIGDNFALTGGYFRVVPTGLGPGQPQYALQAIVPEPASVAIWVAIGLTCGVYGFRRKRRTGRKLV